jgi:hypothetical protein
MDSEGYTVSLAQLVALGARHKRRITRPWVAKYVRRGFLPPQPKPGLGPARGRVGNYTPALAHQLVPLIQALKLHGKNLDATGWDLWWYGWYVAPHCWRELLLQRARQWDAAAAKLKPKDDEDDAPFHLIHGVGEHLEKNRSPHRLLGSAQRSGAGGPAALLSLALSVFTGNYKPLEEHDHSADSFERQESEKVLSRTLGIPVRDAEISTDGTHFPVSVESLDKMFGEMSGQFASNVEEFISSLPDDEINPARRELALVLSLVSATESAIQQQYKRSAGAKALFWANRDQKLQAAHLIGWLFLRRNPAFKAQCGDLFEILRKQLARSGVVRNDP